MFPLRVDGGSRRGGRQDTGSSCASSPVGTNQGEAEASTAAEILHESARRRTFAIISHPDAGKTTLTEKFLLYAGRVSEAGAVKARSGRRSAVSDWMTMERQRGISVTSTVLKFAYRDHVINLLDTPGHRDFSEDTYRVLSAVDAAVMVLDVAKGIEPQTLKLFQVCRARKLPVLTFLNKCDRAGRDPLALLDEIEDQIGLRPTPVTWPVGAPGDFQGVVDRRSGAFIRFTRTPRGASVSVEEVLDPGRATSEAGPAWQVATEECSLLDEVGASLHPESFLAGESSPLFVGSALTNFGVRHLLDAIVDLAPSPLARADATGKARPLDSAFSGFVFKVQANMDPAHRDHVAFVRVCSGRFERGMTVVHGATGRPFSTKHAASVFGFERDTIDVAYPGDVVGLVNASDLHIGDSFYVREPITYPPIPSCAPELFATVRSRDISRYKQFHRGLAQMAQEGVVQVLRDPNGDPTPVVAAVGPMQFEVLSFRLSEELGVQVELSPTGHKAARCTDRETASKLSAWSSVRVLARGDGTLLALFESPYWLERLEADHPDWTLDPIVSSTTFV